MATQKKTIFWVFFELYQNEKKGSIESYLKNKIRSSSCIRYIYITKNKHHIKIEIEIKIVHITLEIRNRTLPTRLFLAKNDVDALRFLLQVRSLFCSNIPSLTRGESVTHTHSSTSCDRIPDS